MNLILPAAGESESIEGRRRVVLLLWNAFHGSGLFAAAAAARTSFGSMERYLEATVLKSTTTTTDRSLTPFSLGAKRSPVIHV